VTPETTGLPLTGERTVPGVAEENYWFLTGATASETRNPQVVR